MWPRGHSHVVSVWLPRNNASGAQSITACSPGFSVLIGMVTFPQRAAAAWPTRVPGGSAENTAVELGAISGS